MTRAPLAGGQADLKYDSLNRLVAVNDDAYRYDVDGLRTESVIDGRVVRYVNDPNATLPRVLEEHDGNGNVIARYVWGVGLISRQAGGTGQPGAGEARFYHFDERGSTIALTDAQGAVTDAYAYSPFGRLAARDGDTLNPFTYIGAQGVIADDNGLYFMRARFYDPHLRRFLTRDDLSNVSLTSTQSTNLYAYATNDPVNRIDPEGELGFIARALAGGIINVAVAVVTDGIANVAAGKGFFEGFELSNYADEFVEGAIAGAFGGFGKGLTLFGGIAGALPAGSPRRCCPAIPSSATRGCRKARWAARSARPAASSTRRCSRRPASCGARWAAPVRAASSRAGSCAARPSVARGAMP